MAEDVEEQVVAPEEPAVEAVVEGVEPHPLEPGGKRFQEVYGDWRKEQSLRERAEAELAALRTRHQPPAQPQQYTSDQVATYLQTQVDQGAITPMAAANALSQFNARAESAKTAIMVEQVRTQATRLQAAGNEVTQYMERIPALKDTNSADFTKVRDAAYSASDDMGLPVTDLRVQRRALREVYGTLDKVQQASESRERSRRASLPHTDTSVGGSRRPAPSTTDETWKKDIPAEYLRHWQSRGYTEQQMKDEARYVTRAPRKVAPRPV